MVSIKRQLTVAAIGSLGAILLTTALTLGYFDAGLGGVLRNNLLATAAFLLLFFSAVRVYENYEKMYRESL